MKLFISHSFLGRLLIGIIVACCWTSVLADDYCDFTVNNVHYKFIPNTQNEVAVSYREYESGRYGGYYSAYTGYVTIPAAVTYNSVTYKVTAVSNGAFAEKSTVTSISLPNTIKSIGLYAFAGYSLSSVKVASEIPAEVASLAFSYSSVSYANNLILYVPAGSKSAYEAANVWKDFKEIVEIDTDISTLDDAIYFEPATGLVGTTIDLNIKVKNALTPVGCSFMLTLPEGIRLQKDADGDVVHEMGSRAKKMSVTMKDWGNGSYDFALMPTSATATITGSDDVVITLHAVIPADMAAGDYKLKLTKCLLQSKDGGMTKDFELSNVTTTLTVEDYIKGDSNGDSKVTPSDAIMTLYLYFGSSNTSGARSENVTLPEPQ